MLPVRSAIFVSFFRRPDGVASAFLEDEEGVCRRPPLVDGVARPPLVDGVARPPLVDGVAFLALLVDGVDTLEVLGCKKVDNEGKSNDH